MENRRPLSFLRRTHRRKASHSLSCCPGKQTPVVVWSHITTVSPEFLWVTSIEAMMKMSLVTETSAGSCGWACYVYPSAAGLMVKCMPSRDRIPSYDDDYIFVLFVSSSHRPGWKYALRPRIEMVDGAFHRLHKSLLQAKSTLFIFLQVWNNINCVRVVLVQGWPGW